MRAFFLLYSWPPSYLALSREKQALSFMRALILFMRASPHDLITSERKALPPKAHAFRVRVPIYEFWTDTNIQSITWVKEVE